MGITSILTKGVIYGIIVLIIFSIVGFSGGFSALTGLGKLLAQIPAWFWIVISLIWLTRAMFGGGSSH